MLSAMPDSGDSHDQHGFRLDRRAGRGRFGQGHDEERDLAIERAAAIDARASGADVGACAESVTSSCVSSVHIGEAGRAVVATVSGNIEADAVDDAEVKTVSGTSRSAPGGGRLAARSISGSVKISVPDGDRPGTRLKSVSGRINNDCPQGDHGEIRAKTVSGGISVTCR
jgi:DUF4097 and DUF4098 domain-containing protein YvlB